MADRRWRVLFKSSAYKEYKKLHKHNKQKIKDTLRMLQINPFSEALQIKKIYGKEHCFRIRVGDYRIIYSIKKRQLIIQIIRIGHRQDIYRFF